MSKCDTCERFWHKIFPWGTCMLDGAKMYRFDTCGFHSDKVPIEVDKERAPDKRKKEDA